MCSRLFWKTNVGILVILGAWLLAAAVVVYAAANLWTKSVSVTVGSAASISVSAPVSGVTLDGNSSTVPWTTAAYTVTNTGNVALTLSVPAVPLINGVNTAGTVSGAFGGGDNLISPGESTTVTFTYTPSGVPPPGTYTGTVHIDSSE